MAQLIVDGEDLVVRLRPLEKMIAFHGDVRFPLRAIRRLRAPASPWMDLRGWRSTGAAFPGYVAMGKRRHGSGWDFTLIYKDRPALIIELNGAEFGEVVVNVDDAPSEGRRVAGAAGITFDPVP